MQKKMKTEQAQGRQQANSLGTGSLVEAIKRDHVDLKKFIEVLKDEEADHAEKKEAYDPFMKLLDSHAEAEEKALYTVCLKEEELSDHGHEGFVEHDIARELMQSIARTRRSEVWMAKVKVLAEVVEHHIEEEENEFLPEVEENIGQEEQQKILAQFLKLRRKGQTDFTQENAGVLAA